MTAISLSSISKYLYWYKLVPTFIINFLLSQLLDIYVGPGFLLLHHFFALLLLTSTGSAFELTDVNWVTMAGSNKTKESDQKSEIRGKLITNPRSASLSWYVLGGFRSFYTQCKIAKKVDFSSLMPNNSKAVVSRRSNILGDTKEGTGRKAAALPLVKKNSKY